MGREEMEAKESPGFSERKEINEFSKFHEKVFALGPDLGTCC